MIRLPSRGPNSSRGFELGADKVGVERAARTSRRRALGHREADEADARVALAVGLAAGHGAGQPFLAVEAVARGEDHVAIWSRQAGPERPFESPRSPTRPTARCQAAARPAGLRFLTSRSVAAVRSA